MIRVVLCVVSVPIDLSVFVSKCGLGSTLFASAGTVVVVPDLSVNAQFEGL